MQGAVHAEKRPQSHREGGGREVVTREGFPEEMTPRLRQSLEG